jgi:hypothetical protein
MNQSIVRNLSLCIGMSLAVVVVPTMAALAMPQAARAGDADSTQTVECLLPGQIRNVDGHATLGARRPVQTTPADCRERGGEYTETEQASQPVPVPHVVVAAPIDTRIVTCLLPREPRRVGEKAHYRTARHSVRIGVSDCHDRGGDVIVPRRVHHVVHKK